MSEQTVFLLARIGAVVFCAVTAFLLARLNVAKMPEWEKLPRHRLSGAILGFVALVWCMPHAEPIAFDWMVPWFWPLVIAGTVLGYFFLDYLLARAVGGIFILGAYYFVHSGFEQHTSLLALFSLLYWGLGIIGICFSGRPCWMRDLLRCCCRSRKWAWSSAAFFILLGAVTLSGMFF